MYVLLAGGCGYKLTNLRCTSSLTVKCSHLLRKGQFAVLLPTLQGDFSVRFNHLPEYAYMLHFLDVCSDVSIEMLIEHCTI